MKKKVRIGWRYRIVTVFGLMWNACAAFDYALTQSRNEAYLSHLPPGVMSYLDGMPLWAQISWAAWVFGGLFGSLLMVTRLRLAVAAFLLALIGLSSYIAYQGMIGLSPAMNLLPVMAFTGLSWFVLAYLLLYALRCWKRILR